MALSKLDKEETDVNNTSELTAAKKRRNRRKKLQAARAANGQIINKYIDNTHKETKSEVIVTTKINKILEQPEAEQVSAPKNSEISNGGESKLSKKQIDNKLSINMSSKEALSKSREDVIAAREAKKLAKLKAKNKGDVVNTEDKLGNQTETVQIELKIEGQNKPVSKQNVPQQQMKLSPKSKDEVDRASVKVVKIEVDSMKSVNVDKVEVAAENSKDQVLTERAAKKAAKQAKKKGAGSDATANLDMTVQDVVETLKDIKNVAKEFQDITAKVSAINFEAKKPEDSGKRKDFNKSKEDLIKNQEELNKSKAELRAERRAKQEAQRAAKQAATEQKAAAARPKPEPVKPKDTTVKPDKDIAKEKSPKPKSTDKAKPKPVSSNRVNWFQHLYTQHDKEALKRVAINSNLHPAVIKLGVQSASHVVQGSNARCIALLDALKKMVKDYTLPAKTEFARGLESHLAASLDFLWAMRQPSASQTNAVKYFRHYLTQLPNNVDEFDAKKTLQEEIDKYIEDQIDKAGEAISMAVRNKISTGDNILTYGCSSLIERILREAWEAKLQFRTVIVGDRVHGNAREMLRRLVACGLPCTYVDITAISFVMKTINKVLLGAGSLLVNGSVLGAAGTAQVALVARSWNVPVLVACETHKVSERVQTDAFVYNEIGDPDALIDKTDENSPLKDWRSNPNLTPLNLTYDVTPPSLVTAVVTEKAILPCTSAPVVLRTKLSEYGI